MKKKQCNKKIELQSTGGGGVLVEIALVPLSPATRCHMTQSMHKCVRDSECARRSN